MKPISAIMAVLTLAAVGNQGVWAQDEADTPKAVPVELYACNWQDGKDMSDLQGVIGKWKSWADKNAMDGYRAWTITPQFRSSKEKFDVGWIGAWPDNKSMGAALGAYRANGAGIGAEFNKVVDCSGSHALFSSVALRSTANNEPLPSPLVQFSSCTVAEGRTQADAFNAHRALVNKMAAQGSTAAVWLMYPLVGAGDIDFDYYLVVGHQNYAELAKGIEYYTNGGGWEMVDKTLDGVTSCDSPRLYDGLLVRDGATG